MSRRPYLWAARVVPGRVVVEGDSMRPALEPGDRLLVLPWLRPRPGGVVAAADPREPGRTIVKRVAAVNADGSAVLLGDAPHASTDSRTFGPVPPALVKGRAVWRYFPPARRGRVTLNRAGTV
jgi:nickel-type superoxide dismutase maturation protease